MTSLDGLLQQTVDAGASDLHLLADGRCFLRVQGHLGSADPVPEATAMMSALLAGLSAEKRERWDRHGDADLAVQLGAERFRVHLYRSSGESTLVARHLPARIPSPDDLGLPQVVRDWVSHATGLVIVTGPTGSGKSTTLASLANEIHQRQSCHIVTIEDPVEFHFPPGLAKVSHREVGGDASGFARAVRAGLREDVDVMVIGEMRDAETIEAALALAETGHLVLATMHTHGAAQTIDRLIDSFPADQQSLARSRLASSLLGVLYQRLLPGSDGRRVAAFEVLVGSAAVRNLIREGKTHQVPNVMETSRQQGMQLMQVSLDDLVAQGRIEWGVKRDFENSNV